MPKPPANADSTYRWATMGDVNAFFGLMLDNLADLVLAVSLLSAIYGFPAKFAMAYMVPGTAIGVLFGDLVYTVMAILLARKTGRNDVTAMPLGLDTPSTFGMVFFVLGPAFMAAKGRGMPVEEAAVHTWHIGICAIMASGIFKLLCAIGSGWIRRVVPRAGLLGSLTAIALVLISFLPLLEVLHLPAVGLISLAVILTTLIAKVEFPGRIPGALVALLIGSLLFYALRFAGVVGPSAEALTEHVWLPTQWMTAWKFEWLEAWRESVQYLPVVIPFALATVVGGIDCTESAAAAGDDYHTGTVIAVEAVATLIAGCCGGVIQSTPYIGHPAYKMMGGRAGYTFATALFIGSAGLIGFFGPMYEWIPKPAIFPILIFIGLEITAQSFAATPKKHYPAVALACVPAMAYLVMLFIDNLMTQFGLHVEDLKPPLDAEVPTLRMLAGGFIVTSLLWGGALAAIVDRRLTAAAAFFGIAGVCSFFGVIHSLLPSSPLALPWNLPPLPAAAKNQTPYWIAGSYGAVAIMLLAWQWWDSRTFEEAPKNAPTEKPRKPQGPS
jgi:AGZA family xanthine/uracil permease-like MFS transporter